MLEAGQWVPEKPGPARRGYHISSLYSPVGWQSWAEIAEEWETAQGNPEKLKVFVNTVLAETWKERGEAPDWQRLYNRRDRSLKLGIVPKGGLVLTAAADVQKGPNGEGWIEVVLYAWGRNLERWVVDHQQFHGDTSNLDGPAWKALEKWSDSYFPHDHAGVAMPIRMLAVDSSDQTSTVYAWCASRPQGSVMAIKGLHTGDILVQAAQPVQIKADGKKRARATKLWRISLNIGKPELYAQLRYELDPNHPPPRGYIHFPELSQEFFEQLTGEEAITKKIKGRNSVVWEKKRARVEVLDCTVYARAAAYQLRLDEYKEENWVELENQLGIDYGDKPEIAEKKPKKRESKYWSRR
jgi:phage terminase large subunit GpA-like protein